MTPPTNETDTSPGNASWPPRNLDSAVQMLKGPLSDPIITGLCFFLLLLPLVRVGSLEDSFNTPKTLLALLVVCGLGLWAFLGPVPLARGILTSSPAIKIFLISSTAFFCLQILSLTWAKSLHLGYHGIVHLWSGLAFGLLAMLRIRTPGQVACLLAAGVISAVIVAAWTIMEDAKAAYSITVIARRLPDWRGFLAAGLGNSGHIAGWCGLFLLPFFLFFGMIRCISSLLIVAALLLAAVFVITWSVGSTSATLVSLFLWLLIAAKLRLMEPWPWKRIGLAAILGALAAAFYLLPHPLNPHNPSLLTKAFGSQRWKDGLPTRLVIYETTVHMIAQKPLLGWGVGNFTLDYIQQAPPRVRDNPDLRRFAGAFTNDAHNDILQVTYETGIIGLSLVLAALLSWFAIICSLLRPQIPLGTRLASLCLGYVCTVFLLDGIMSFPSRLPAHWIALCLMLGSAVGLSLEHHNQRSSSASSVPGFGFPKIALGFVVLFSAVATLYHSQRFRAEYHLKQARLKAELLASWENGGMLTFFRAVDQAISLIQTGKLEGDPEKINQGIAVGNQLTQLPGFKQILEHLRASLAAYPRYSNAGSRLAAVLLSQGRWDEALAILQTTSLDLQSAEVLDRKALCYWLAGDHNEAITLYDELARRQPQFAQRHNAFANQVRASMSLQNAKSSP